MHDAVRDASERRGDPGEAARANDDRGTAVLSDLEDGGPDGAGRALGAARTAIAVAALSEPS